MIAIVRNVQPKYWVLADQMVVSGTAFLTNLFLARALGAVGYGTFSAIAMVQLFVLSIVMASSTQIYQVVYHSLNDIQKEKLTAGMLIQQLFIGLVIILLAVVCWFIMSLLNFKWYVPYQQVVLLVGISTCLYILQDFLRRVFIAQNKVKQAFLIDIITNAIQLIALVIAWFLVEIDQFWAWLIIGFSFIPSVVLGIVLLRLKALNKASFMYCWSLQKNKIGWLVGSSALQWGSGYFFVLASGWWLGVTALGALRLVQYLFGMVNLILQAFENYALPKLTQSKSNRKQYYLRISKKFLLIVMPFLIVFCVFAKRFLHLLGGEVYEQYTFVIYGLSLVYIVMAVGYPIRMVIRVLHLDKAYFTAYIISVAFSLISAPWLLANYGLIGVLVGLMGSQLVSLGYWVIILQIKHSFLWKSST